VLPVDRVDRQRRKRGGRKRRMRRHAVVESGGSGSIVVVVGQLVVVGERFQAAATEWGVGVGVEAVEKLLIGGLVGFVAFCRFVVINSFVVGDVGFARVVGDVGFVDVVVVVVVVVVDESLDVVLVIFLVVDVSALGSHLHHVFWDCEEILKKTTF